MNGCMYNRYIIINETITYLEKNQTNKQKTREIDFGKVHKTECSKLLISIQIIPSHLF